MDMIFREYGNYIIATISVSIVIAAACLLLGFYKPTWISGNSSGSEPSAQVKTEGVVVGPVDANVVAGEGRHGHGYGYGDGQGNGLFGYVIGKWLNRIM